MTTLFHRARTSETAIRQRQGYIAAALAMVLMLTFVFLPGNAGATTRTFPKGSYIIPQDICWQPNKDPKTWELCGNTKDDDADGTVDEANTVAQPYNCIEGLKNAADFCDENQNDQGLFQSTGLIYDILSSGFPVYWIINPNKTSQVAVDLSVSKLGAEPAVKILHSPKADSGTTLTTVNYMGGPFVIDANDMDPAIQTLFDKYANAKIHQSNYDFSAEVDKVLSGTPPKVAVLNEGSVDVLTDYLFASGLGNTVNDIFQYITSPEIIAGALKDFQLIWAPHWVIDDQSPVTVANRPKVISGIRTFLESGNAGFFECASIQSLERGYDHKKYNNQYISPDGEYGGGYLLDKTYLDANGRIETNGTNLSKNTLVFEAPTHVLTQCGGWDFRPVSGVTEDIRPSQLPATDYVYNSTVQRFIHDSDTAGMGAPKGYDYFLGGRINGNATQGYVAYLGGHKYVQCTNATDATPVTRILSLEFNADLDHNGKVWVEVAYSGCANAGTVSSTCPKAFFDLTSMSGSSATDANGKVFVDLDSAIYGPDADPPTKFILGNIVVGNKDITTGNTITGIYVTFAGNPSTTVLQKVLDMSGVVDPLTDIPVTICSPNSQTPAQCPAMQWRVFALNFDAAVAAGTVVTVEAVWCSGSPCTPGCTPGVNCPKAVYDPGSPLCVPGTNYYWDNHIFFYMCPGYTSLDPTGKILRYLEIFNADATAKTLTALNVTFPGNGATKLTTILDYTSSPASTACTSNSASPANCPNISVSPVVNTMEFGFSNTIPNNNTISIVANYTGAGACGSGSVTASYLIKATPTKTSGADACVSIDMSGANFSAGKLTNVRLSNLSSAEITVNSYTVTWGGGNSYKIKTIKSGADGTVWSNNNGKTSPYTCNTNNHKLKVNSSGTPMSKSLTPPTAVSLALGQAVSKCDINWSQANTCGIKYILNTLIGLQFQIIPNEYAKAGAIQKDNILYKSTFEFPGWKGHLYAIDVTQNPALVKWDAGKRTTMPPAGSGNPPAPTSTNASRYIFTNKPGTTAKIGFDISNTGATWAETSKLWHYLDPSASNTLNSVKALINSVRGRKEASDTNVVGIGEISKRLGGIEHSSPAVMGRSDVAGTVDRDKIVFAGADDGMLHAFYAGAWDSGLNAGKGGYKDAGTGKEIWAYIPPTLLGSMQNRTFTDCNPGDTVDDCVVPSPNPDGITCICPTFSNAVAVDSAPALGDFYVDHDNDPATPKQWRSILVGTGLIFDPHVASGTAEICGNGVDDDADGTIDEANTVAAPDNCYELTVNKGIIFALDVTDPYDPKVLWEKSYDSPESNVLLKNKLHYYPAGFFTDAYTIPEKITFDPNMGTSKGVSIGRVQVGTSLDTYVFLTSKWVRKVEIATTDGPLNSWGLNAFALDFYTGNIVWETKLVYTGDAAGVNETPAIPSLLDSGNNGTSDYVVFGDMQGRLWVLRATDGTNLAGNDPAFDVGAGPVEPIGAMVAISGNSMVFGTGGRDSLTNEKTTKYRVFGLELAGNAVVNSWKKKPEDLGYILLGAGEKVFTQPTISTRGKVYIGTAKGYVDIGKPNEVVSKSTGNLLQVDLATGAVDVSVDVKGSVLGGITVENNHVSLVTFDGRFVQLGGNDFTSDAVLENPIKTLWWRTLDQ